MAIDESDKHTLSVWSWQEESVVVKSAVRMLYLLLFAKSPHSLDLSLWGCA